MADSLLDPLKKSKKELDLEYDPSIPTPEEAYRSIAAEEEDVSDIKQRIAKAEKEGKARYATEKGPIDIEGGSGEVDMGITPNPLVEGAGRVYESITGAFKGSPDEEDEIDYAEEDRSPSGSFNSEYPNFWVGAAPLLMGALMGDVGAGAGRGSSALLQRYKDERDAKLAEAKKSAESSKRGTFQIKNFERADGSIGMVKVDTRTGEMVPLDYDAGYKRSITKDPITGELASISGATRSHRPVKGSGKYTVKQQKDIKDFKDKLMSDKVFSANRETVSSTGRALSLLEAGNPIADAGIKTIFPRMFGEVGNLAAAEQERFSGSPAVPRKLEALKEKFVAGTLTDDDRKDLVEVARVMANYSKRQLEKTAKAHLSSEERYRGYSAKEMIDPFLGGREQVKKTGAPVRKAREEAVKKSKGSYETIEQNGWIYIKNPDGTYEPIKKVGK